MGGGGGGWRTARVPDRQSTPSRPHYLNLGLASTQRVDCWGGGGGGLTCMYQVNLEWWGRLGIIFQSAEVYA